MTSGSGDQRQNAMLMILLAQSCTVMHGFVRCSALNGPKSDPNFSLLELDGNVALFPSWSVRLRSEGSSP